MHGKEKATKPHKNENKQKTIRSEGHTTKAYTRAHTPSPSPPETNIHTKHNSNSQSVAARKTIVYIWVVPCGPRSANNNALFSLQNPGKKKKGSVRADQSFVLASAVLLSKKSYTASMYHLFMSWRLWGGKVQLLSKASGVCTLPSLAPIYHLLFMFWSL